MEARKNHKPSRAWQYFRTFVRICQGRQQADPAEKSAYDEIDRLAEEMLDLQKQHQQAEAAKEDARFALEERVRPGW